MIRIQSELLYVNKEKIPVVEGVKIGKWEITRVENETTFRMSCYFFNEARIDPEILNEVSVILLSTKGTFQ